MNYYNHRQFVSVIIPVFNDNEHLQICLEALQRQTYPQELSEIIVIDNGSTQDVESVVNQFAQVKLTYESQPGSYAARNKGISLAKGEIIAFTDADCIPGENWLENGVEKLLNTPNCGLVAGEIKLFFKNPQRLTAVELFEKIELNFFQREKLQKYHFGMTANLFTFKHVIEQVGDFDSTLKSGGDHEWGERVYQAGFQQVYAENAYVFHPARHSFSQLRKRISRLVGGSFDRMMNNNPSLVDIMVDLLGTFKPPLRSLYRAWTNENLRTISEKIKFIRVMFFARYIVIIEKIRLYLGADTQRG
ncbi:glycosyltransferase [Calothrix sp. NIES-3974]|uniref:glycosyltransferase n=1 Tax=Calothrix sp. NIES-3974 TaxID=2005462 RepID=UPI000B5F1BFD|nr:glycosyltransferase family A protein [Calothrix sp. NIES-3974]BAZ06807.1 glycosyl transferase, group 2 family protein [Calothrix sp. NIES-3974]